METYTETRDRSLLGLVRVSRVATAMKNSRQDKTFFPWLPEISPRNAFKIFPTQSPMEINAKFAGINFPKCYLYANVPS